jgi:hypothetical protein
MGLVQACPLGTKKKTMMVAQSQEEKGLDLTGELREMGRGWSLAASLQFHLSLSG